MSLYIPIQSRFVCLCINNYLLSDTSQLHVLYNIILTLRPVWHLHGDELCVIWFQLFFSGRKNKNILTHLIIFTSVWLQYSVHFNPKNYQKYFLFSFLFNLPKFFEVTCVYHVTLVDVAPGNNYTEPTPVNITSDICYPQVVDVI